jgi:hypothetical protein
MHRKGEEIYSKEEREVMLQEMEKASNEFYNRAVKIKCHPFIEFTGFMNEWIKLARKAHDAGIDFTQANTHSGQALPMQWYEAGYIGEKFDCIFGPSLRSDPKLLRSFLAKMGFGEDAESESEHADHGRGTVENGPDDPDCPCRGTSRQGECSANGCGFCLAAGGSP